MPRVTLDKVPPALRYRVTGSLPFPIDMLRYDACWPASEEDSYKIQRSISDCNVGVTVCEIRSRRVPTLGRWESFGWTVHPVPL